MTAPPAGALGACPFCGNTPIDWPDFLHPTSTYWRDDDFGNGLMRHYVSANDPRGVHGQCWELGCLVHEGGCGATVVGDSRDEAIAVWNRRTHGPALATALRLREGWRPIESAPKEVDVLVYMRGAAIPTRVAMLCPVRSDSDEHRWLDTGCNALTDMFEVAAWMPLPAPPTADDLARVLEEGE